MSDRILARIIRHTGISELYEILSDRISLTDLQSLLLSVYRRRVSKLSASDLLRQYRQNRFVCPSPSDPEALREFTLLAMKTLPADSEFMQLSPLSPLGASTVIAPVNQNNVITTIRNTEVSADCTSVLAMECALRRQNLLKKNPGSVDRVMLASSQRVVRGQSSQQKVTFAHFELWGMCTAGRDQGSFHFEKQTLKSHISFYLNLISASCNLGYRPAEIRLLMNALNPLRQKVLQDVTENIRNRYPEIKVSIDPELRLGQSYYREVVFQIHIRNRAGEEFLIADGGFTDWTRQFLNNQKERLLISGFGTERFVICYR